MRAYYLLLTLVPFFAQAAKLKAPVEFCTNFQSDCKLDPKLEKTECRNVTHVWSESHLLNKKSPAYVSVKIEDGVKTAKPVKSLSMHVHDGAYGPEVGKSSHAIVAFEALLNLGVVKKVTLNRCRKGISEMFSFGTIELVNGKSIEPKDWAGDQLQVKENFKNTDIDVQLVAIDSRLVSKILDNVSNQDQANLQKEDQISPDAFVGLWSKSRNKNPNRRNADGIMVDATKEHQ